MTQEEQNKLVVRIASEHALTYAVTVVLFVALGAWIFSFSLWSFVKCSLLLGGLAFVGGFLSKWGELDDEIKKERVRQSARQS
ncbi:hypothetical protein [Allomesorhizobium camelthorni]|uniref:Uncharacterized protein n=1 Tax=Allomesorhizobium camelthorni TaxID=475069 RepID=A0A6G4WPH7_9HYPH|nr:hypothetical protein [Mesorhizobium camelthorni]NGO56093.1 hypothetical protein [Mesorhizobium camelthorni]